MSPSTLPCQFVSMPSLEILEAKCLLSVDFTHGVWTIQGDGNADDLNDNIVVQIDPDDPTRAQVLINDELVDSQLLSKIKGINIYGGEGDDTITIDDQSSSRGDSLAAISSVLIDGGAGNDTIVVDEYEVGDRFDVPVLLSKAGKITIQGGDGDDTVSFWNYAPVEAWIYGGSGNDMLSGGMGVNHIFGGDGDDVIHGSVGADQLDGGSGDDVIYGHGGNDTIVGGDGDDYLFGGAGNDNIQGGAGNDVISGDYDDTDYNFSDQETDPWENFPEGSEDETDEAYAAREQRFAAKWFSDTIDGGDGDDIIAADDGNNTITGGAGDDEISTGDGNNRIDAGDGNNTIYSGAGNDTIRAGDGDDEIDAGEGDNDIDAGNGNNLINVGDGNDTIASGSGNDQIAAGEGNNRIHDGGGKNLITSGAGDDTIRAGGGDDQIEAGDGNNSIDAGDGNNSIVTRSGNDTIVSGAGNDRISAGDGNNRINAGDGDNYVEGGAGNDTITAGDGDDVIGAGDGDNRIDAGNGNNSIYSGEGNDTIATGSGDDSIEAGDGSNRIDSGAGNDTIDISGSSGSNVISGGDGDDTIDASYGEGTVTIDGGNGNDLIDLTSFTGNISVDGGAGDDEIYLNNADGTANVSGGAGNDTIDAGGATGTYVLDGGDGNDSIIGSAGDDTIRGGEGDDDIDGGDGNDRISGGQGGDTIDGGDGDDRIKGGQGGDTIDGGAGDDDAYGNGGGDDLSGGDGDDDIYGGLGDDSLDGGAGSDTLAGGGGRNYFVGDPSDNIIRHGWDTLIGQQARPLHQISAPDLRGWLAKHATGGFSYWGGYYPILRIGGDIPFIAYPAMGRTADTYTTTFSAGSLLDSSNHSSTNTQVAGVDEGDIVETDGRFIYTLGYEYNQDRPGWYYQLTIVDAADPSNLHVESTTAIEGYASAMYLDGDKITVLSSTSARSSEDDYYYSRSMTKMTVLGTADAANPAVREETYYEGYLQDSRAVGDQVYLVLNDGVDLPYRWVANSYDDGLIHTMNCMPTYCYSRPYTDEEKSAAVDTAMRGYYSIVDGQVVAPQDRTGDIYMPTNPTGNNVMTIVTVNVADDQVGPDDLTTVVGVSGQIYATQTGLYLADQVWVDDSSQASSEDYVTEIYKFDMTGGGTTFAASGCVPGRVLDQFSMDEYNGTFRIATTTGGWWWNGDRPQNTNSGAVFVLQQDGDTLKILGSVSDLGQGETVKSVRFMGERAFVTTFKNVDPLFAIDLTDPAKPAVKGELTVPGFSNYLQPVDANHLLGIGYQTDAGGRVSGMKLSLFDVSDMTNPVEVDTYTYSYQYDHGHSDGGAYTWEYLNSSSAAQSDHHAVGYYADFGILALPVNTWESGWDGSQYHWSEDHAADVFSIDVDKGFQKLGSVQLDSDVRRTVQIDDVLFTISQTQVKAVNIYNPAEEYGALTL